MKRIRLTNILIIAALSLAFFSCQGSDGKEQAAEVAERFSVNFYTLRLNEAMKDCTPESEPFIALRASNITEEVLEKLKKEQATTTCSVEEITEENGLFHVKMQASVAPTLNALNQKMHIEKSVRYTLCIRQTDSRLLVDLPQSRFE